MDSKPRKPWLAGALTFFSIGLGHLYGGNIKKGIVLFFGGQLFVILGFSSFLFHAPVGPLLAISAGLAYTIYCIYDSINGARLHTHAYSLKKYNRWYFYLIYWLVASFGIQTLVELSVKENITQAYKIPSGAMKPTLQIGDLIMADKFIYKRSKPKRGDIVIFPFPEDTSKDFIKRIVGIGGDTIEIANKQVLINGVPYQEKYKINSDSKIIVKNRLPRDNFGPIQIPQDSIFVMGDNRDFSYDSRFWGFVKTTAVKGKAISIYWSWDKDESKVRWNRIGNNIK